MIVLVRIDDRLIHGQVVEGWIPALKADTVFVVSDQAAEDPMQTSLMELGMPEDVKLQVLSLADAPEAVKAAKKGKSRILVLVPGPREAAALLEAGVAMDSINVGGMHYAAGTLQLGKAIFMSEDDIEAMETIAAHGVKVEGRAVPSDFPIDVISVIRERG